MGQTHHPLHPAVRDDEGGGSAILLPPEDPLAKGGLSFEGGLDAAGLRIAVVVARFNAHVTGPLYDGCRDELAGRGLDMDTLTAVEVPGCFELPVVAKELAAGGRYDAVICIGAIIRRPEGDPARQRNEAPEGSLHVRGIQPKTHGSRRDGNLSPKEPSRDHRGSPHRR